MLGQLLRIELVVLVRPRRRRLFDHFSNACDHMNIFGQLKLPANFSLRKLHSRLFILKAMMSRIGRVLGKIMDIPGADRNTVCQLLFDSHLNLGSTVIVLLSDA